MDCFCDLPRSYEASGLSDRSLGAWGKKCIGKACNCSRDLTFICSKSVTMAQMLAQKQACAFGQGQRFPSRAAVPQRGTLQVWVDLNAASPLVPGLQPARWGWPE